jgi:hypothetical protein
MVRTREMGFGVPGLDWRERFYHLGGIVHVAGSPEEGIPGVRISAAGFGRSVVTDPVGRYALSGVPGGEQTLRVEPPEGPAFDFQITVPGDSYDIEIPPGGAAPAGGSSGRRTSRKEGDPR